MFSYGFNSFGPPLPFIIEIEKQTEDYSVTTFGVLKITHHLQTPPYLSETPLNHVGGANNFMELRRKLKEGNQPRKMRGPAPDTPLP
jgi:hypothetical protein